MPATTPEDIARLRRLKIEDMADCVVPHNELHIESSGSMTPAGLMESPIIGAASPGENLGAGKMAWDHGFQVRHVVLDPAIASKRHARDEEEVIFVQNGRLTLSFDEGEVTLERGDVFTVPVGKARVFSNNGEQAAEAYIVRGGTHPAPPRIID